MKEKAQCNLTNSNCQRERRLCLFSPLDITFFRKAHDLRYWSASQLPSPLTLYGALGNCIINYFGNGFDVSRKSELLGEWNRDLNLEQSYLHISGPFLIKNSHEHGYEEIYLPAPNHMLFPQIRGLFGDNKPIVIQPSKLTGDKCDLEEGLFLLNIPDEGYVWEKKWLKQNVLMDILWGKTNIRGNYHIVSEGDLFTRDIRYGHKIAPDTKTVEEPFFFAIETLDGRSDDSQKDTEFACYLEADSEIIKKLGDFLGIVRLGGEGHQALLKIQEPLSIPIPGNFPEIKDFANQLMSDNGKFLLYFATPAIFIDGWRPKSWRFEKTISKSCELKAVALNKPEIVSGIQITNPSSHFVSPRPFYQQVPAGAVYFFEATDWKKENFEVLLSEVHGRQSQSEVYPAAGFGMIFVGRWPQNFGKV